MTATEIARRSDALYADGTCGMTRRVLCDMVAQRESDLEDARTENSKLRVLALTLAFCANDEADCDQCPMNGVSCDVVQQCFCDGVAEALRELGLEVE